MAMETDNNPSPRLLLRVVLVGLLVLVCTAGLTWWFIQWRMAPPLSGNQSHDFGEVAIVSSPTWVDHTFMLTNTSGKDLTIRRAVPDCGCTEIGAFNHEVPAGQDVRIPVRLKLVRSVVEGAKVTLTFGEAPPMSLQVTARGRRDLPLQSTPTRMRLRPGQTLALSLTLERWADDGGQLPTLQEPADLTVDAGPWKQVRRPQRARGTPQVDEQSLLVTANDNASPGVVALQFAFDGQVLKVPVDILPALQLPPSRPPRAGSAGEPSFTTDSLERPPD